VVDGGGGYECGAGRRRSRWWMGVGGMDMGLEDE
jgi:hypothetical protein